jgi:hypothetical protein
LTPTTNIYIRSIESDLLRSPLIECGPVRLYRAVTEQAVEALQGCTSLLITRMTMLI